MRIRGSSWRIAEKTSMVAFTELSPLDSIPLMRWRPRWARWSFEPYGIAIRREIAEQLGARPVRYVSDKEWRSLSLDERPFAHGEGEDGEWPAEREWRMAGDVDLRAISTEGLRIIARHSTEIGLLDNVRGITVCSLMH
jgi:hypothetical protein